MAEEHLYNKSGQMVPDLVYQQYNEKYFGGKLPLVPVRWSPKKTKGCAGTCHFEPLGIFLNPRLKGWDRIWGIVLLHEMIHVEQRDETRIKDHGRKFQQRMKQLARQGAFQDLW